MADGGFAGRAASVISNAALYQLVEDLARAVDHQARQLANIYSICSRIMEKVEQID